ncbi:MAG TPA: riboflavin synthase [Clostridiaceae bacterium]|nr:riboflavin synthase [Clostridiaceae bacterium]
MFTGIIEEQGELIAVRRGASSSRLTFRAKTVLADTQIGDSIAVNGLCLTVTDMTADTFSADVMSESLRRSNLGDLRAGQSVNMERALTLQKRLGGHLVSGHIDGTGTVVRREQDDNAVWFEVNCGTALAQELIPKGSVAIDGISLTIVDVRNDAFTVSIIPHTMQETTLSQAQAGTKVNLETDMIGKYVRKALATGYLGPVSDTAESAATKTGLTLDLLAENGFL